MPIVTLHGSQDLNKEILRDNNFMKFHNKLHKDVLQDILLLGLYFISKEMNSSKVILPVWHKVSKNEVINFSPTLADKIALKSSDFSTPFSPWSSFSKVSFNKLKFLSCIDYAKNVNIAF